MVLEVLQYPDPLLHQVAQPIAEITPEIVDLARDMAETMYAEKGIGLAAPQVGRVPLFRSVNMKSASFR